MGIVYFVTDIDDLLPIKIGFTTGTADERLSSLQTGSPVKLKCVAEVEVFGYASELHIHRVLSNHRLHGEWFARADRVLEMLAAAQSGKLKEAFDLIGLNNPWDVGDSSNIVEFDIARSRRGRPKKAGPVSKRTEFRRREKGKRNGDQ